MINLNTENRLPKKLKWYSLVELTFMVFLMLACFLFLGAKIWLLIFALLFVFVELPMLFSWTLDYKMTKFVVDDNKITINSGILVKRSKAIAFDRVQNVESIKGVLRRMFGLATVKIWTSSASQINVHKAESENTPDGKLTLESADAEWLKNYILDKQSKK